MRLIDTMVRDIARRLREKDSAIPVSIDEFCLFLRQKGLSHKGGYFHYTTWGRLNDMLKSVDVGNDRKKRLLLMTAASSVNDSRDSRQGAYIASFSYGSEENVAMWTNYGVPKREAVRIRFPMAAMTKWARENPVSGIPIYVLEGEQFRKLNATPAEAFFADVAYYGVNDSLDKGSPVSVRYRNESCAFGEEKWRRQVCETNKSLLFKKRGWSYESEVRLIVRFDVAAITDRYRQIAVPFDTVYDAVLSDVHKNVLMGPWHDANGSQLDVIPGITNPSQSSFCGELHMRSNCDCCERKKNSDKCSCPNAEWRLW